MDLYLTDWTVQMMCCVHVYVLLTTVERCNVQ